MAPNEIVEHTPTAGRQTIESILIVDGDGQAAHAAIVEHPMLPDAFATLADMPQDDERMALVEINHAVDATPDELEALAFDVLDASGAERLILNIALDPDLHEGVSLVLRGHDRLATWMRHLSARERAGGAPDTRADRAARMGVDAEPAPAPRHALAGASDRKAFANKLRTSLRANADLDIATSRIGKSVAAAMASDGAIDARRLGDAIGEALGMPARVGERFAQGARRATPSANAAFEACLAAAGADDLAFLSGRSGEILANPGFQRLVRDVRDGLREDSGRAGFELARAPGDPRLAAMCLMLIASWSRGVVDASAGTDLVRSDEYQFAAAVTRGMAEGDPQAFGDRYAQAPRTIAGAILASMIGSADHFAERFARSPSGSDVDLSLASALATEPALGDRATWNYGPRWRRLDAPDLVLLSKVENGGLLGRAWVRTTSRKLDPDMRALGVDHALSIPGESPDHDDSIWILGVGPHPWAVAPLAAAAFERDATREGHLELTVSEFAVDAGVLTAQARTALARTMASQTLDDLGNALERSPEGVTLRVSSMGDRPDPAKGDESLPLLFMGHVLGAVAGMNDQTGRPLVRLLDNAGDDITPRVVGKASAPSPDPTEAVRLHAAVGRGAWGAVAVVEPGEQTDFARVDEPGAGVMDEAVATVAEEGCDDEDIVDAAAMEAEMRAAGFGNEDDMLELALARHGRAMLVVLDDQGMTVGADFANPAPGEDVADALERLLSRHRAGHAPAWDLTGDDDDLGPDDVDDWDATGAVGSAHVHRMIMETSMPDARHVTVTVLDAPLDGVLRDFATIGDDAAQRRFAEAMSDVGVPLGRGTRNHPFVSYSGEWRGRWQLHALARAIMRAVGPGGLESAACMGAVASPRGGWRLFGILAVAGDGEPFVIIEPD